MIPSRSVYSTRSPLASIQASTPLNSKDLEAFWGLFTASRMFLGRIDHDRSPLRAVVVVLSHDGKTVSGQFMHGHGAIDLSVRPMVCRVTFGPPGVYRRSIRRLSRRSRSYEAERTCFSHCVRKTEAPCLCERASSRCYSTDFSSCSALDHLSRSAWTVEHM